MQAKYTCLTAAHAQVEVIANVERSVDQIKALASRKHGAIIDVIDEVRLGKSKEQEEEDAPEQSGTDRDILPRLKAGASRESRSCLDHDFDSK